MCFSAHITYLRVVSQHPNLHHIQRETVSCLRNQSEVFRYSAVLSTQINTPSGWILMQKSKVKACTYFSFCDVWDGWLNCTEFLCSEMCMWHCWCETMIRLSIYRLEMYYNYTVTLSPRTSENQRWSLNRVTTTTDFFLSMILICHINHVEL